MMKNDGRFGRGGRHGWAMVLGVVVLALCATAPADEISIPLTDTELGTEVTTTPESVLVSGVTTYVSGETSGASVSVNSDGIDMSDEATQITFTFDQDVIVTGYSIGYVEADTLGSYLFSWPGDSEGDIFTDVVGAHTLNTPISLSAGTPLYLTASYEVGATRFDGLTIVVPEPASALLLAGAGIVLAIRRRRTYCNIGVLVVGMVVAIAMAPPAGAAEVTYADGDSTYLRGSLIDVDGNGLAESSRSPVYFCEPSAYAGDAAFPDASLQGYGAGRRAIVELDLAAIRAISTDPVDLEDATLTFHFDAAIHEDLAPNDFVVQSFMLEAYTDSANGTLDSDDTGAGADDYSGPHVATWTFSAGDGGPFTADGLPEGPYGPDDVYAEQFTEAMCQLYGYIWFEVDISDLVADVLDDPSVTHIGLRWIGGDDDIWTSMDGPGYLPSVSVNIVPEPTTAALLLMGVGAAWRRTRRRS